MALTKKQLQKRGPKGHNLAHITPLEGVILKALGGSGKVNPRTGLRSYYNPNEDRNKEEDASATNETLSGYGANTGTTGNLGSNESQTETSLDSQGNPYGDDDDTDTFDSNETMEDFDDDLGNATIDPTDDPDGSGGTTTTTTTTDTKDDKDDKKEEEEEPPPVYPDWKGVEHDTPEGAEAANAGYLATGKTDLIGSAEGFDQDLSGDYRTAYEQQLADAYEAAYAGVGQDILNKGGGTGTEYDDLETLKGTQEDYLTELANNYQEEAQTRYNNWLTENTDNINKLTNLDDIKNYKWTGLPEYDTDLSGGYVEGIPGITTQSGDDWGTEDLNDYFGTDIMNMDPNSPEFAAAMAADTGAGPPTSPTVGLKVWQEDWMPEFFSGHTKVYDKKYTKPSGWEYDADGNPVPGSAATDQAVEVEETQGSTVAEEPTTYYAPGNTGATSKARSSAKYYK